MQQSKKTWLAEYHRTTTSEWFRELGEEEKKAVLLALEERTPASAARYRAVLTAIFLTGIGAVTFGIWGFALNTKPLWFALTGAFLGAGVGVFVGSAIASQKTAQGASDIQLATIALPRNIALIASAIGLVVWVARTIFG
jgi:hypothetical protein